MHDAFSMSSTMRNCRRLNCPRLGIVRLCLSIPPLGLEMQTESRLLLRLFKDEQGLHHIQDQLCRWRRISALLLMIVSNLHRIPPSLPFVPCLYLTLAGAEWRRRRRHTNSLAPIALLMHFVGAPKHLKTCNTV